MNKLQALRLELEKESVDGFIVPMSDEYGSEYVPAYARRLEWITGFTGSAGLAIILRDKAAFFTDGRYTIQAANEVKEFELFNISAVTPADFLSEQGDLKIAYDPELFTYFTVQNYISKCQNIIFQKSDNLIDRIWINRPERSSGRVTTHDIKYAGVSSDQKCAEIAKSLHKKNIDALFIADSISVNWLLNIRGDDLPHTPITLGYAILFADGTASLIAKNEVRIDEQITPFLRNNDSNIKNIQLDPAQCNQAIIDIFNKNNINIIHEKDPCLIAKSCKNAVEIQGARLAHQYDAIAMCKFIKWMEENVSSGNVTEISASDKLSGYRLENSFCKGLSFDVISGYGQNGAIIHYKATQKSDKIIDTNSLYLVDSGGQYCGDDNAGNAVVGTTDITRTFHFGTPTNAQKKHYTLVLKGHIALACAVFPIGTTGHALDALARQFLWNENLDFEHGTGHGVGSFLNVHEGPQSVSKKSGDAALMEGMIISNEPGYYLEGEYGIRIESLMVVQPHKKSGFLCFETLTKVPISTNLIDYTIMNNQEIKWLEKYNKNSLYQFHIKT